MKKLLFVLIMGLSVLNCATDEDDTNPILGEWKLITTEYYGQNSNGIIELFSTDYSDQNIVYHFKANGSLEVSGSGNSGYPSGEFDYILGNDSLGSDDGPQVLMVKINSLKWIYKLNNGTMTLGRTYVDGSDLIFKRK